MLLTSAAPTYTQLLCTNRIVVHAHMSARAETVPCFIRNCIGHEASAEVWL